MGRENKIAVSRGHVLNDLQLYFGGKTAETVFLFKLCEPQLPERSCRLTLSIRLTSRFGSWRAPYVCLRRTARYKLWIKCLSTSSMLSGNE